MLRTKNRGEPAASCRAMAVGDMREAMVDRGRVADHPDRAAIERRGVEQSFGAERNSHGRRLFHTGYNAAQVLALILLLLAAFAAPASAQAPPGELRWAGDPEGGAPYVEASPTDPDRLVGFDVEIAELIARGLGRHSAVRRSSRSPRSINRSPAATRTSA